MIEDAGMKGFGMFELGKVGIFIALAGIIYLLLFSTRLLPADRPENLPKTIRNRLPTTW